MCCFGYPRFALHAIVLPSTIVLAVAADAADFAPMESYYTECNVISAQAVDLNNNGSLDLVGSYKGCVSVMLNNGSGTFAEEQISFMDADMIAAADLNNNGIVDLAIKSGPYSSIGTISIALGNGDGSFQSPQVIYSHPEGTYIVSLATGDMNSDGLMDIVAVLSVEGEGAQFIVLAADGRGGFLPAQSFPAGPSAGIVKLGDLSGNGFLDVVVANRLDLGSNTISVMLANIDGTYQQPQVYTVGQTPSDMVIADLNLNGMNDLVVANFCCHENETLSILWNTGGGALNLVFEIPTGWGPSSIAVGDLNGNGWPDIAVGYWFESVAAVHFATGTGSFGPPQYIGPDMVSQKESAIIADFDNNGKLDLAVSGFGELAVFLNDPDPTPIPGDLNGDGVVDVSDLLILLSAWGACENPANCPADLNGDGTVDTSDLLLLLANWG